MASSNVMDALLSNVRTVGESSTDEDDAPSTRGAEPVLLLALYVIVMIYAFFLAPGSLFDLTEVLKVVSSGYGPANDIFAGIFNLLVPIGLGLFGMLSAGAPAQKELSTELFGVLSSFLGFYGGGLYLALRRYAPRVSRDALCASSFVVRVMQTRLVGAFVTVYGVVSYAYTLGFQSENNAGFVANLMEFGKLVQSDRYVFATALDLLLLAFLAYGPLVEDMRRRGWRFEGLQEAKSRATASLILLVPGVGVGIYLLTRPPIL